MTEQSIQIDPQDLLRRVRETIEAGWIQRAFSSVHGVCLMGGIHSACRKAMLDALEENESLLFETNALERRELAEQLAKPFIEVINGAFTKEVNALGHMGIPHWNDQQDRTKDEVIAMIDKVLEQLVLDQIKDGVNEDLQEVAPDLLKDPQTDEQRAAEVVQNIRVSLKSA